MVEGLGPPGVQGLYDQYMGVIMNAIARPPRLAGRGAHE